MDSSFKKKIVTIVGGGPAALMLAAFLDERLYKVTIYEKNKALGRKFLVAGKGGFNLTHSEGIDTFIKRYTPDSFLERALRNFTNEHLRYWLAEIGIPTFVGSSKRIFPTRGIKPIEVLGALTEVLKKKGVRLEMEHTWTGFNDKDQVVFNVKKAIKSDFEVFALGGGSWKVTGSDGKWIKHFARKDIHIEPFKAANCGYQVDWPKDFISKTEGHPLKNIAISCGDKRQLGELIISKFGLEGGAIYALSPQIQSLLEGQKKAEVQIDLKPTLSFENILNKIQSKGKNTSDILKRDLKMSPTQVNLLKAFTTREEFLNPKILVDKIKGLRLNLQKAAPIDEAISTTGGIALDELDQNFELKKMKHHFCIGEMVDWNAPTGGYLLQACFSMGVHLARHLG